MLNHVTSQAIWAFEIVRFYIITSIPTKIKISKKIEAKFACPFGVGVNSHNYQLL